MLKTPCFTWVFRQNLKILITSRSQVRILSPPLRVVVLNRCCSPTPVQPGVFCARSSLRASSRNARRAPPISPGEPARAVQNKLEPMLAYLNKLRHRMQNKGSPLDDELWIAASKAQDAMQQLTTELR